VDRARRSSLTSAIALAALATAYGCERPAVENTIVIGVEYDVGALLPIFEGDRDITHLLYLGLNSARWERGRVEYIIDELSLAERWAFSADSTVLTYYMKTGAEWSDGEPIDAADVVFTYELLRQPEVASPISYFWEDIDSVVAVDAGTVAFHFARRSPIMLFRSGIGIMPEHVFSNVAAEHDALASHPGVSGPGDPVVSGPFLLTDRRPGESFALVPNPFSVAGPPNIDRIVFRIIPEDATRVIELETGGVDVISPVPLAESARLSHAPGFRVAQTGQRYYEYVAWNERRYQPFSDRNVRLALSLAIDRENILRGMGIEEFASLARGPISPLFPQIDDPSVESDPFRPDSAAALLDAAGWRDSDGDGVRDRDGQPLRFVMLAQSDNQRRYDTAGIIQAQLAEIGVDVELRTYEWITFRDIVFNAKDFEAALAGWSVTLELHYLDDQFHPVDADYNITGYTSAALDSLVPAAKAADTESEAAAYWRAAAVEIARDRPFAFLWFHTEGVALSDRISDYKIDFYSVYQNLHRWTVDR
jgi:peptide/nickel transport system substrate-binding protein